VQKGGQTAGRGFVGKVTVAQVRDIAEQKMKDLNAHDIDAAAQMIRGTARSMGIEVEG
jgi:large subunit ribosomal protein L11